MYPVRFLPHRPAIIGLWNVTGGRILMTVSREVSFLVLASYLANERREAPWSDLHS